MVSANDHVVYKCKNAQRFTYVVWVMQTENMLAGMFRLGCGNKTISAKNITLSVKENISLMNFYKNMSCF